MKSPTHYHHTLGFSQTLLIEPYRAFSFVPYVPEAPRWTQSLHPSAGEHIFLGFCLSGWLPHQVVLSRSQDCNFHWRNLVRMLWAVAMGMRIPSWGWLLSLTQTKIDTSSWQHFALHSALNSSESVYHILFWFVFPTDLQAFQGQGGFLIINLTYFPSTFIF